MTARGRFQFKPERRERPPEVADAAGARGGPWAADYLALNFRI
jgi:hypothetical protein